MGTLLAHQRLVALTCSVILPRPIVTHMGIQQVHRQLAVLTCLAILPPLIVIHMGIQQVHRQLAKQICSVIQQLSKGAVLEAVSGHGNIIR